MNCHSIYTALLMVLTVALCADGRTWRARVGNQQVDAEFIELRGSDVILERTDGRRIQVPLEKLSLEDVRYVEAQTKGVEGGERPFRYGFKPGVRYNYAYRLDARLNEDSDDDAFWLYGGVGYTMLPANDAENADNDDRLAVDYHASLYMKGSGKFKMGSEGAISHWGKQEHGSLVINDLGEYVSGKYDLNVPFLFAPLSLLPLDQIAVDETSWVVEDAIKLVTKKVDASDRDSFFSHFHRPPAIPRLFRDPNIRPAPRPILDPFSRPSGPRISVESEQAATERCEYRWGEASEDRCRLHRRYELHTVDGDFQADYESVVTFDRKLGIPLRMDGQGTIQRSSGNITVKTPVRFTYRLSQADAWRASEYSRLIPNLFEVLDEERSRKFRDQMQNGTANQRRDLMYYLKTLPPADYRDEIAAEIGRSLGSEDFWQRYAAAQSIRRWATAKEAAAILEAVRRGGKGEYYSWVLIAAGRFPSAEAAEAVATALPAHLNPATAALIEMGPAAEDAAIELAEASDGRVRWHAAAILGVIGTQKSLPVLSKLTSDGFTPAKDAAVKAHRYLQARLKASPAESPPALATPELTSDPDAGQEAAIAAIKMRGGKVKRDDDGNVVEVSFLWRPVADADLEHLQAFTKLENLNLNGESFEGSQITDAGIKHLQGLNSLRFLYLGATNVGDDGVAYLKELKNLRVLNLQYTKVGDAGLEQLKQLTRLKDLLIDHTQVTGEGLEHLQGLVELECLDLTATKVDDDGLEHLKGLTKLKRLALGHTEITNDSLECLTGLTELEALSLQNTGVTSVGLKQLSGLSNLRELDIRWTRVSDAGLEHLGGLESLQLLILDFTDVTHAGVEQLRKALPDCVVSHTLSPRT